MINDLKMGFRVIKYALSFKSSLFALIVFAILGCAIEFMTPGTPLGGLYLAISAIFVIQLVHSVCVSAMVQTSPYKKKLQTVIPACMTLAAYLIANTIQLIVKFAAYHYFEKTEVELSNMILISSIFMLVMTMYVAASFKAFWPATIIFFAVFLIVYPGLTIYMIMSDINESALGMILPLWVAVLISYVMIIVSSVAVYLISLALYKRDYSKTAFQAALDRAK